MRQKEKKKSDFPFNSRTFPLCRCVVILGCPAHNHDGHVAAKNNCLPRHRDGTIDAQRDTVGRDRFVMGNVYTYAILV